MSATTYANGKTERPLLRIAIPSWGFARRAAARQEAAGPLATREELQQLFGTELSRTSRVRLSSLERSELQKNAALRKALYDDV
ncbi:hypothetical protein [Aliiroseovarius sp. YM-037]|uniref:hypothetical protein n=1 Tax=Aliiroseovarius sp. YM-037 TaxID=3341728 RepID=UPI003A801698